MKDYNEKMREKSGQVCSNDAVVNMLYLLARDHLNVGAIESVIKEVVGDAGQMTVFTNGWLAQWATNASILLDRTSRASSALKHIVSMITSCGLQCDIIDGAVYTNADVGTIMGLFTNRNSKHDGVAVRVLGEEYMVYSKKAVDTPE